MTDRRNAARYRLILPACFSWAAEDGATESAEGVTRNLGSAGVFVLAHRFPPVGTRVQVDVFLPTLDQAALGVGLSGEGRVLRVCLGNGQEGFAATVQFEPKSLAVPDDTQSQFDNAIE